MQNPWNSDSVRREILIFLTVFFGHLRFIDTTLLNATITGAPATFELKRPESEDVTYAEAGRVDYDLASGIVEFSDNATITEAGNQISSNYLVYNIAEQRINAQSADSGERVKIIYTPNTAEEEVAPEDAETDAEEATEDSPEADSDAELEGSGPP